MVTLTDDGSLVRACWRDPTGQESELLRYVYKPPEPQLESPRPYFHPLRTLRGDVVSMYRPHDHVWHKGIAWSLPNVGPANFWGGPTYQRGHGYRQIANNGRIRHDRFGAAGAGELAEELTWVTEDGETWFSERRRIGVRILADASAWTLTFRTEMRNVSPRDITIGSPTTEGRENAGYGGLFWRGPRSFTGGRVITPDGEGGDEYMGWRGPWLGFTGRHDGHGRWSTVLMADHPGNISYPTRWFVRSEPYACLCPAPFFADEYTLASGGELRLSYAVAVADGSLSQRSCQALAVQLAEQLDEHRAPAGTPGTPAGAR